MLLTRAGHTTPGDQAAEWAEPRDQQDDLEGENRVFSWGRDSGPPPHPPPSNGPRPAQHCPSSVTPLRSCLSLSSLSLSFVISSHLSYNREGRREDCPAIGGALRWNGKWGRGETDCRGVPSRERTVGRVGVTDRSSCDHRPTRPVNALARFELSQFPLMFI